MKIQLKFCNMMIGLVLVSSLAFTNCKMRVEDNANKMTTALNLTADQISAVGPVIQDFKDKMDQMSTIRKA